MSQSNAFVDDREGILLLDIKTGDIGSVIFYDPSTEMDWIEYIPSDQLSVNTTLFGYKINNIDSIYRLTKNFAHNLTIRYCRNIVMKLLYLWPNEIPMKLSNVGNMNLILNFTRLVVSQQLQSSVTKSKDIIQNIEKILITLLDSNTEFLVLALFIYLEWNI